MQSIQSGALNHGGHPSQVKPFTNSQAHQHNIPAPRVSSNDDFSRGLLTPEKTQAILNKQLAEKIQAKLPEGIELNKLDPAEFTAQKVADRIFGFIEGRVNAEQDPEKRDELLSKAREGVEQGFKEAREILNSLGALQGKVKEDIDQTYSLIQERFNGIENKLSSGDDSALIPSTSVQETSLSSALTRNISSSIEITTKDGDSVKIDLYSDLNAQSQKTISQNENGSSITSSSSISLSSGISYQVEGNLDDDEKAAIEDLLKDIEKVSRKFFNGNIQKAFEKASELELNTDELENFSLDMQYQQTREVAVSSYQQNQNLYAPVETDNETDKTPVLQNLSNYTRDLDKLVHHPAAEKVLDNPFKEIGKIFKGFNQLLQPTESTPVQKKSEALLDSLLNKLVDGAEATSSEDTESNASAEHSKSDKH